MQLETIKVFCDLINLGSFSKAAQTNEISQPTVSRFVHQLEQRLGGQLIDRSKRPLEPTALGQAYYEGCKRLLEQYAELEVSLRREHAERALTVRVAAIYSVGLGDMGQYIERFQAENANARVQMEYLHPDQVYQRVRDEMADIGLVSFPARSRDLTIIPWRDEEMVVVCTPDHALARFKNISATRLDGEKIVAFDRGLVIRRKVDSFLRSQEVVPLIAFEFDNIENIKKAVEVGGVFALLPEPTIRQEVNAGRLVALHLQGAHLVRPLGIIHRRQPALGSATLAFIDLLQTNGSQHQRNGYHRV
ncbi:MAG TPA: LysR family transcriptional regulator [Gemmataceae bacterium]|nr:LysR family transcriptional regulator [Gemmataceae bacterium]